MQYKLIDSLAGLEFDPRKPLFFDIETEKLYVGLRLVQLFQPPSEVVYIIDAYKVAETEIKAFLMQYHLVGHNISYDLGTLNISPPRIDDTFYAMRTAYPKLGTYSLDVCVAKIGHDLYKDINKKLMQKTGFKGNLTSEQLEYAALDPYAVSLIYNDSIVTKVINNNAAYRFDIKSLQHSLVYQTNGLVVDQKAVAEELQKVDSLIEQNATLCQGINPNSPKQVTKALGLSSSSKQVLIPLVAIGNKLAEAILLQRKYLKRKTMLNSYNHPKVYTRFNPAGAITGRFTASGGDMDLGINAQQIPRALQYLFQANTETTSVIHADYSTAELRAGCSIMKDSVMYAELKNGVDLHRVAATLAINKKPEDMTKEERQKGKAISFGFIFGMSANSFQEYAYLNYGVSFTANECKEIKRKYQSKYRGITNYQSQMWDSYKHVPVSTPLGRRAFASLGTDAINYATQGCIAETTKIAVDDLIVNYPEAVNLIFNVVHDAIDIRVPTGTEAIWVERLVSSMKKGWQYMCTLPMLHFKDIPMPVEVKYFDPITSSYIVKEY